MTKGWQGNIFLTMPMRSNRVLEKKASRTAVAGSVLIALLNDQLVEDKLTKAERRRIESFLENLAALIRAIECPSSGPILLRGRKWSLEALQALVNEEMSQRYPLPLFSWEKRKWDFDFGYDTEAFLESQAVRFIVELAESRELARLRRCICGKWIFARFRYQQFCSSRCRHRRYESSEEFRAMRRQYMRDYYRLKTSGKVK